MDAGAVVGVAFVAVAVIIVGNLAYVDVVEFVVNLNIPLGFIFYHLLR